MTLSGGHRLGKRSCMMLSVLVDNSSSGLWPSRYYGRISAWQCQSVFLLWYARYAVKKCLARHEGMSLMQSLVWKEVFPFWGNIKPLKLVALISSKRLQGRRAC
ncbi:hypothetical protein BR93DRAFT_257306 [Coniochaeta sp. PMI_546]|nr:hypothetical protein BR93DRAFT_257306 [Coniochaeta sp. PMI_546]